MKGSKKGKKTFTENLGEVFSRTLYEDNLYDKPSMLIFDEAGAENAIDRILAVEANMDDKTLKNQKETNTTTKKKETKKQKTFADSLEGFLSNSIEEAFDGGGINQIKRSIPRTARQPIGIDVLLNRTLVDEDQDKETAHRITFTLEADKIEKLKIVARRSNKLLNDLLLEMIEGFLKEVQNSGQVISLEPKSKNTKK